LPHSDDLDDLKTARAQAYDLVFNGLKLAAAVCGFISAKFKQVFEAIGLSLDQAYNKFGFLDV